MKVVYNPYYLLRLDWNLILRSGCTEYAMRKLQSPTWFGSKYLDIQKYKQISKFKIFQPITKINDVGEEQRRKCKSIDCLGMLFPSSASLAEEAVLISENWIKAFPEITRVNIDNYEEWYKQWFGTIYSSDQSLHVINYFHELKNVVMCRIEIYQDLGPHNLGPCIISWQYDTLKEVQFTNLLTLETCTLFKCRNFVNVAKCRKDLEKNKE